MWPNKDFFLYFIEMTVTLLTFYFESYKGAVLIRPLQRFSGMTGQQMELTYYSTTHATRWANQQKYRTVCTHALNKRHPETWHVRNLACMFYSASQRVQRAITLCGMWVSEYELLITGSQDLQIVSSHPFSWANQSLDSLETQSCIAFVWS